MVVPDYLLRKVKTTELQERYEQELYRSTNLKEEIKELNQLLNSKEKELHELKEIMQVMAEGETTGTDRNTSKHKKRRINDNSTNDDQSAKDSEKKNQEIERLKKQNENLNQRLDKRETALDETLQKLVDALNHQLSINVKANH